MSTQTEVRNDARSLNDIMMTDKLIKCASVSRKKNLTKEFKNWAKKSFEKLLILFIRQEVCEITV